MQRLVTYDWPGNVRELRLAIEAGLATSRGDALDVPALGRSARPAASETLIAQSFRDAKAAAIESFERRYFGELVAKFPTLAAAASAARLDRKHLRVLLRRYGLRDLDARAT